MGVTQLVYAVPGLMNYIQHFYLIPLEWRWFKSQGIAESNLNEHTSRR